MYNIVKGYTGIIAPNNLAGNGSFRINQRATDPWIRGIVGTYVADLWYIGSSTIDYLECNQSVNGQLALRGHGKKGQTVYIYNRESAVFGISRGVNGSIRGLTLSSWVTVYVAPASVPVNAKSQPQWNSSAMTNMQDGWTACTSEVYVTPTKPVIYRTQAYSMNQRGRIGVQLNEDGEFDIALTDYCVVAGAYQNPPQINPVPYMDDLLRCKRWYQFGEFHMRGKAAQVDATIGSISGQIDFIQMAGTPTIVMTPVDIFVSDGAGNITIDASANATVGADDPSGRGFNLITTITHATQGPQAFNNGMAVNIDWTAYTP